MENSTQTILADASDKLLQEPITIEVDIRPQSWFQSVLQRTGIMKKKRRFVIHPITLGSLIRISKYLLSINIEPKTAMKSLLESSYHAMGDHGEKLAFIVAVAIQNNRHKPSDALVNMVLENFTSKELLSVCTVVLQQMDLSNFLTTIISIRGMNILENRTVNVNGVEPDEVSPLTQGRNIAPGTL